MGGKGHHPSSSESDDWGDESWIVDCPCGVNFDDGEEMVECDECGVWVHTACCRVPKGLPTYVCDKCQIKEKLKESESEVAQLLAELPGKNLSFDERSHEKAEASTGHLNSSEIPIKERAHMQGIPGGHPSFFVGVSKVFCRQLWKYTGYVPKYLNIDHKEFPEPREDVSEFLRDLPDFQVPLSVEDRRTFVPDVLENGHVTLTPSDMDYSRDEVSKEEEARVQKEAFKDKQCKNLLSRKADGKHSKHRHRSKVKEEKPHHHGKRARDEGGQKEHSIKKKTRNNGDVRKPEDGLWKKVDVSSPQEAGLLDKSPQSSPKNPKAMKKLAVQEFMDGDMFLCSRCGLFEDLLARALLKAGGRTEGGSDLVCLDCERLGGDTVPVITQLETGSAKHNPGTLAIPSVVNTGTTTLEVRLLPRRELDYSEAGIRTVRFRDEGNHVSTDGDGQINSTTPGKEKICNDSSAEIKKLDVDKKVALKLGGIHENLEAHEEKLLPPAKMEGNVIVVKRLDVETEVGEIFEELDPHAERSAAPFITRGEPVVKTEGLCQVAEYTVVTRPNSANEAEGYASGDPNISGFGNKEVVSNEGRLTGAFSENLESSSEVMQVSVERSPVVPSVPCTEHVPTEAADESGSDVAVPQGRSPVVVVPDEMEDKVSKFLVSSSNVELKGQGSARTSGHLPASVRGKMLVDRSNQQLQRSAPGSAGQSQAPSLSGQALVQPSLSGTQRSVPPTVSPSRKGGCGEDTVVVKQHGQVQLEGMSPTHQFGKHLQQPRVQMSQTVVQKSPTRLSEMPSPSQPSCSAQHAEPDQPLRPKGQPLATEPGPNEVLTSAVSAHQPQLLPGRNSDTQELKLPSPTQVTPTQVFCQQARQLNGIGHVYSCRPKSVAGSLPVSNNCAFITPFGASSTSPASNVVVGNPKASVGALKSPSSGNSSSSPTSPLVTTPSSKPQPPSIKVPGSPPPQKSLSGGSTPKASNPVSNLSSKPSSSIVSSTSVIKQVGTLHSSKSVPSHPSSPVSTKVASISKHPSRSSSLSATKTVDVSSSVGKTTNVFTSRGASRGGKSIGGFEKDNVAHPSSKTSTAAKTSTQPAVLKPPSSKSSHSHVPLKGTSGNKHHSGLGSGTTKASTLPTTTKYTAAHHSKVGMSHKEEKPSMPLAPPVPKAMSTMPPPPPHVSTKRSPKRSPPTVLTSSVATTLKDEELALLLHQELNSSPRVPRVPRVRQAGASLQLVSSPSLSAKGSFVSATSGGSSHKDHHPAPRKRTREDRHKDLCKSSAQSAEDVGKSGAKRSDDNKVEDVKGSSDKVNNFGMIDGNSTKEKSSMPGLMTAMEANNRHYGFAKGNLSIIVPGTDDSLDGDKKSPVDDSVVTLPGLIDEVLSGKGHHLSYEDVCEAVLPHWPKLRKPNGERYAYASHRQAVLDCLRNRSAWAHLVDRGPKTNLGRKRKRNDSTTVSDTDEEEELLGSRDCDQLDTSKSSKRPKELDVDKWDGDGLDDVPKGRRKARRRRRVAIEDGTDGEEEPTNMVEKVPGRTGAFETGDDETSPEEELDAASSPSSEEAVSNYSEEDEEMVVHRGMRNRRRLTDDESSDSEDDMD